MKKQPLLSAIVCCICLCFLAGCGTPRITMKMDSFINQDLNVAEYNRFSFLSVNSEKPLMEKQLFTFIRSEMEKKGYLYDDKNPQFLIVVKTGTQSQEKQEGVHSRPVQVYQSPSPGQGGVGTWQTQYVTEGGGSYIVHTRWMKIDFVDVINKKLDDKITYLWQGEIRNIRRLKIGDDGAWMDKCFIMGLLEDYPSQQASLIKKIERNRCR